MECCGLNCISLHADLLFVFSFIYHSESLQNDDGPDVRAGSGDILLVHATETERKGRVLKLFTYCLIFLSLERSEFISHLKADLLRTFLCVSGIKQSHSGINSLSACACSSHFRFVFSLYWLISRQHKNAPLIFYLFFSTDLVLYCEAFLTTYRTFITPEDLIKKLHYRYPFQITQHVTLA